jgi:hypothetical protein
LEQQAAVSNSVTLKPRRFASGPGAKFKFWVKGDLQQQPIAC